MYQNRILGLALFGFALHAYAADPACAKMKSWKKIEGYSYSVKQKTTSGGEEEHSETEAKITFCNKDGEVVWVDTYTSEYIEISVTAKDLNGDKTRELLITASMGAAYPYSMEDFVATTSPSFTRLGSFLTSMYDGELSWQDLNKDKIPEAIMSHMETMSASSMLPDVYAFGADGTLKQVPLKEYPGFIKDTLDALYERCAEGENISGCADAEVALQLAKSGGDMTLNPSLPALASTLTHASFMGWSEDGAEFGYCAPVDGSTTASRCEFASADTKKTRTLTDDALPDKTKEIKAEAAKKRVSDLVSFKVYADLRPVWKVEKSKKGPTLKIGAQRLGNQAAYLYSVGVDLKAEALNDKTTEAHPEVISLSPDGTRLGVLVHFTDGTKNVYKVKVLSVDKLAGNAYNVAGLEYHKKELFGFAAPLFAKSYAADKEAKWPAFNMACAYARLGDEYAAKSALEKVAAQKNPDIFKKIATDPDLESLHNKAWFKKYTP
jgi:hypothetical protein